MRVRWIGLAATLLAVSGVLVMKQREHRPSATPTTDLQQPSVVLVADLREAGEPGDACAEIIQAAREARSCGVRVQELMPDSSSDVLRRYWVLTVPTVLILAQDGHKLARFEGEG
jgi:hypothetical protein